MSLLRAVTAVAGVVTVLLGVVLLVTPPLAVGLTTSEAVVSMLGVAALVAGAVGLVRASGIGGSGDGTGHPGAARGPTDTSRAVPGATFEQQLRSRSPGSRDRLETAAVAVLTRLRGLDAETARKQLEDGDWTDSRAAAAFFSPSVVDRSLRRPPWLGGEPPVVRQARAVVGELARIVREETPDTATERAAERDGDERGATLAGRDDTEDDDRDDAGPSTARLPPLGPEPAPEPGPPHIDEPGPDPSDDAAVARDGGTTDTASPASTGRWAGFGSLTVLTVALAAVTRQAALLVPAAIGVAMVAYAAYGRAGTPSGASLVVDRTLSTDAPEQGDAVMVTVTVRNEGDAVLPDVRLVDGVPDELPVTGGQPRAVTTLRPDEVTRFTYTVTAEYGDHEFDSPVATIRDATGERERVVRPTSAGTTLTCRPRHGGPTGVPLRAETTGHAGRITADDGGSGLSFHAVRDHRPGDPLSRIDWKRLARTGDLATTEFEQERRTDVVLAVDSRPVARQAPDAASRSARHRAVEAADVLATTLLGAGNQVGVSAVTAGSTWLAPGGGADHRARLRELLATDPAFTATDDEPFVASVYVARLRRQLHEGTQVVLLSPLLDDTPVELVRQLEASGVPVTVVSPDPTASGTVGGALAGLERRTRIATLRRGRVHVVDWAADDRLDLALARNDDLPVVVA